ncbi:hypothetical protein ACXKGW_29615, partial [Klebsiella pneumoniae subsp. pneumoniae]
MANLAVSVAGFALTLYKLQGIENQLRHMDGKLDDIRQGVEWLDVRQMISRLAPLHAALQHVREAGLYRNAAMMQQAEQLQMLGVQQQLIMGLEVANLAVSVAGFALTLYKLQGIENQLRHM